MGRYKKNPDYDSAILSKKLLGSIVFDYNNPRVGEAVPSTGKMQITKLAEKYRMSVLKIRKLLVSSGELVTDESLDIQRLKKEGKSISEIAEKTKKSKSTVNSWLKYSKIIYRMDEVSPNAIRMKRHREKIKAEKVDIVFLPAIQSVPVPRWERTNIIRAVPRGKLILEQQIVEILEAIHGPFEYKGYSYEILPGWPLPPLHVVLKRGGYVKAGYEQWLREEGFELEQVGEKYKVADYKKYLISKEEMLDFKRYITTCPVQRDKKTKRPHYKQCQSSY